MDEYKKKIGSGGDSGPACLLLDYKKHFPDAKILIIERDPKRAIEFMRQTHGIDGTKTIDQLKSIMDGLNGLRIPFQSINERLPEIWSYLSDDPYNDLRGKQLIKMNIQVQDVFDIDHLAMRNIFHELKVGG